MAAPPSPWGQRVRTGLALGIVIAVGALLVTTPVGEQSWALLRDPSADRLVQALPATAMWLAVAMVGLMILHTLVPLPAELLALAAGMVLGPFWGVLITWIGAMLGAWLGFFLARALGRPILHYFVSSPRLERWLGRLRFADVPLLLAVRLLPIISFNLINYGLGLSPIGWWRFTWTACLGILPVTIFAVVFGAHLHNWRILVLMSAAAILVGLGGYLLIRFRSTPLWHRRPAAGQTCAPRHEGIQHGCTKH